MTDDINRFTDPTAVGPGVWWLVHTKAKDAIDDRTIKEFMEFMLFLRENFSCKNCRKHIKAYIETHAFKDLLGLRNENGERIGMFKWAWMFHNAVNARIHKPYVEWETAVDMFYNDDIEVCSTKCDEAGDEGQNNVQKNNQDVNDYEIIKELPVTNPTDRKSKLAQSYFMSIGIPNTLRKNGIYDTSDNNMNVSFVK